MLPTDGCYAADRATLTFLQKPMSTYSGFSMFVERILHPKSYSCIYIYSSTSHHNISVIQTGTIINSL